MGKLHSVVMRAVMLFALLAAASCDSIYENDADCSTKFKFVFTRHRQALHAVNGQVANAFGSSVGSVHLFVYNSETGELVCEKFERTDNLKTETELNIGTGTEPCFMAVDLAPGNYHIVAWCGLEENDQNNAFSLTSADTRAEYAECGVKLTTDGRPVNHEKYEAVYHGIVNKVTVNNGGAVVPVELTKNTNDIAVWVQHTSSSFSPEDYEVVYTDANGTMKFDDNSLSRTDRLEYHAHTSSVLTTSMEYNGAEIEAGALVTHLSTSRLMEANRNNARLEVRNRQGGNTVFSIPFIEYVLEMQSFTSDAQYYLDCEDTYNCSFYLSGEGETWTSARIIINNWVRVPDQTDSIGGE